MRDNGFVYLAKAFAHQPQFFTAVAQAAGTLQLRIPGDADQRSDLMSITIPK